jgi:hypothetical protein
LLYKAKNSLDTQDSTSLGVALTSLSGLVSVFFFLLFSFGWPSVFWSVYLSVVHFFNVSHMFFININNITVTDTRRIPRSLPRV